MLTVSTLRMGALFCQIPSCSLLSDDEVVRVAVGGRHLKCRGICTNLPPGDNARVRLLWYCRLILLTRGFFSAARIILEYYDTAWRPGWAV